MNDKIIGRVDLVMKSVEGTMNLGRLNTIIERAKVMNIDAIPIEQLKGDIARAGHPVKQALALDAEGRRLFFTDKDGEHLYAEFDTADNGHQVTKIGHQSSIIKEYSVDDLETDGVSEVETVHDEEDAVDEPGMYPGGTPGDKPEEDDRGFSDTKKMSRNMELRRALMVEMKDG